MAKKRANGEGNIRKRKDGRWEGRYTAGHDPETGKAIHKNVLAKTQKECKEKLAAALEQARKVDASMRGEHVDYSEKVFYSSEPRYQIFDVHLYDYNFTLQYLSDTADIQSALLKLEPIFNLYLSLFRYQHMPPEMVFLNMVQALETFHSRFFYDDKKEKYVESVYQRFSEVPNFKHIEKLLLSDTQMDKNCNYIILVSGLNDLLIGKFNGLFSDFYMPGNPYAQRVADTRHYYTHYGKSKEAKAFKGEELLEAIYILRLLLEYHICQALKIDIEETTRENLASFQRQAIEKNGII